MVISCRQEGALWVWPNFCIWMASGQDSYRTHKISCRLVSVQWSYKHLIFLGEMLKMVAPPRPHCNSEWNNFNNFWSQRGQEHIQWFSRGSNKIPRRSSLNSDAWNCLTLKLQREIAGFLSIWQKSPGGRFVCLDMLYMPSKFHLPRSNHWFFLNF